MKMEDLRKLMLGDLVIATVEICDDDFDNEVTYRIPSTIDGLSMNYDLGEGWNWTVMPLRKEDAMKYDRFDDIEPIPLTAEILEKNGFEKPIPKMEYYDMFVDRFLVVEKSLERWHIRYGCCSNILSYVHELQHALRLCGLSELADNFKI